VMKDSKLTHMAMAAFDNTMWDVKDMLGEAIECIDRGEYSKKKAIVIFVNDDSNNFEVGYMQSNMRQSEVIAACDIMKTMAKQNMGYYDE